MVVMTEETNTEESKKDFPLGKVKRIRKFKVLSNGFDIDLKISDMEGKTIFVIPAYAAGTFTSEDRIE